MEFTPERSRLVEKMFDAALKVKMNELARKYDHSLVLELWARMKKNGCIKPYFCKWRWKPDMTITEAMDCLDDYFAGIEILLQKRQAAGDIKEQKNRKTGEIIEKVGRAAEAI